MKRMNAQYIIESQAKITPSTWHGRTRLKTSGPIPPKTSGLASSMAMIIPNVVTTTNQKTLL